MRTSLDRLAPALVADDLSVTEHVDHAHLVAALGYASRVYPLASALIRVYLSHDRGSLREARALACKMARQAAARRGYRVDPAALELIGRQALDYAINKVCPRCHGTRYELIPGTVCLSGKLCQACHGDGRRLLPRKYRALIVEVVARIERIESNLDAIVAQRV